jgi:prepilin-type N-terminal cleavage/methylation domain-containing protein
MVAARKFQAGFTLTETMVVVVIIGILAAISTPLLTRDNKARKGRSWANLVAQTLQKGRFQAMGDRNNIHLRLYRTHIDVLSEDATQSPPTYTLLSRVANPAGEGVETIAIWDAKISPAAPTDQNADLNAGTPATIVFTPLGSTLNNQCWWIYIRNEFLPPAHPDAGFLVKVGGLTGYITTNDKWVPSQ